MRKECLLSGCSVLFTALLAVRCLDAQEICRPPRDLLVCQDDYDARGSVFLVWTNGETTYTKVQLYIDHVLAEEKPGNAHIGFIDNVLPGPHTFEVKGTCGQTTSPGASSNFEVVTVTPHAKPIESIQCSLDVLQRRLKASWVLSARPSLFVDVYVDRVGFSSLIYITTLAGDATSISIDSVLESDRLRFQFFDENCYGSELISCPGPSCRPPLNVRVCQDLYDNPSRVLLTWTTGADDNASVEVLVDGESFGRTDPSRNLFYVDGISAGLHTFGVRGVCGDELTPVEEHTFQVLIQSPHSEPARNLHCARDLVARTLTATWLPGAKPSSFIDVYLRRKGVAILDFVGKIGGDSTRLRVKDTDPSDELVLQFFDANCYGSPLLSCGEEPGSRRFLRGDVDGSSGINLSDAIAALQFLFLGGFEPLCQDAADANDDADLNISDPVFVLQWLFIGGTVPPTPGPLACGLDPTADGLGDCLTADCE